MIPDMKFNLGNLMIETTNFDSYNEMSSRIKELKGILLESEEGRNQNILLKARLLDPKSETYCGITYIHNNIRPQIASHLFKFHCWIAFDNSLAIVSFKEPKCVSKIILPAVFWDLILLDKGSVLVVHELGAICFDETSQKKWELIGNDMLTDYQIDGNRIICKFDDGLTKCHELQKLRG